MRASPVHPAAVIRAAWSSEGSIGIAEVVLAAVLIAWVLLSVLWLWTLIEAMSWPRSTWEAAGVSRARWVMRILLLGWIEALLYRRGPRRALRTSYAAIRWGTAAAPDAEASGAD